MSKNSMAKKATALLLCGVAALSMAACGGGGFRRDDSSEEYDPTKTYLNVGNYNGGLGYAWLREVADKYEAAHPDVKIKINNEKDKYMDATLLEQMANYGNDMYFVNAITYQTYVARGKVADITDVVTENIEGESESIEDKMNSTLREYYKTADNKYYAVPFFDGIFGTVYDVDLFEDEGLYFNTSGKLICDDSSNTALSKGPNGIEGDYDDGLPATYTEWKTLLNGIKSFSYTPYIWTGEHEFYRYRWLAAAWADYEGKENFDLNMSFDGSYTFEGDTEATKIDINNAYLLQKQQGKKYALNMAEYIVRNNMYVKTSFDSINTHTMAQKSFLQSVETSQMSEGTQRVAMIFEGGWWENEAKDFFGEMADVYANEDYAFGTRKFGFMPMPKSDDGKSANGTTLISSTGNSVVFVCQDSKLKDLAKDFLQFAHSDESLRTFTRVTGSIRPYDYTLEEGDTTNMTHYAKNMWDIYHNENAKISYVTLYENNAFLKETAYLGVNGSEWWWRSTIGSASYIDAFYEFSQEKSLTAEKYYNGLQTTFSESKWKEKMKDHLK